MYHVVLLFKKLQIFQFRWKEKQKVQNTNQNKEKNLLFGKLQSLYLSGNLQHGLLFKYAHKQDI